MKRESLAAQISWACPHPSRCGVVASEYVADRHSVFRDDIHWCLAWRGNFNGSHAFALGPPHSALLQRKHQIPSEKENSPSFWHRFLARVQTFKDFLSVHYCSFLDNISATVFLIIIIVIILALLAIIAIVVVLANAPSKKHEPHSLVQVQRTHTNWPQIEGENPLSLKLVSSKALLPPNVSLCDGFGFSCTSLPSLVIGTLQRCDGVVDCPDGSDEVGCKVCQTVFSCNVASPLSKPAHLVCLRGSSISDGVKDCADNSDESRFRRKKCAEDEFRCHGTDVCLPSELLCDGDAHCRGGEDELQCEGKCRVDGVIRQRDASPSGSFVTASRIAQTELTRRECSGNGKALCENSKICLDRSRICDGIVDCPNGDDESQCPGSCPRPLSYAMVCNLSSQFKVLLMSVRTLAFSVSYFLSA
uniref:Uncharacterized protein n=1 Tax=Parascaris equorum TaxID=6256 RepID=A0A914S1D8_PAREQ